MKSELVWAAFLAVAYASEAGAKGQVVLSTCLSQSEPTCMWTEGGGLIDSHPDCPRRFVSYFARIAFWNGRMVSLGDIQIDIETRRGSRSSPSMARILCGAR